MSLRRFCGIFFLAVVCVWTVLGSASLHAVVKRAYPYAEDLSQAVREVRDNIDDLKHVLTNQQAEICTNEEKYNNLESSLDYVRQQVVHLENAQKDLLRVKPGALDSKVSAQENTLKGVAADIKLLRDHLKESQTLLSNYKKATSDIENVVAKQQNQIDGLQKAMKSLMDAMQLSFQINAPANDNQVNISASLASASSNGYQVVNGDSLEKIARRFHTTIQQLKETNHLKNDKIIVGQMLKIPAS